MNFGKFLALLLPIACLTMVTGLSTAQAATITYNSTDVPKAIVDNGTITSSITVPYVASISDLNVQLDITHSWDSDLDIFLIAPDGTSIELTTDNGGSANNYSGTLFDDEAATLVTSGVAPFAGSYQPEGLLSDLDGAVADGTWVLEITDDSTIEAGILNTWSLTIEYTDSPYPVSTYTDGLSAAPAGLTVDLRTRTFYYAENLKCEGVLRKIAPDGTVSIVTNEFSPGGCGGSIFYPYVSTDIQFLNGSVYVPLSTGGLASIASVAGTTTIEHTFVDFSYEGGIDVKNGQLLVTSGQGTASEIQSYNISSKSAAVVLDVSPLTHVYNVEYDPARKATYFWSGSRFYLADLGTGSYTAIPAFTTDSDDFDISPDGNYLLAVKKPSIYLVSVDDGSSTRLYNSLTATRNDMVFAPSSSGSGCSLYVADGIRILEVAGFGGRCKPFSWGMFLPAITK